jgi:hypothetical protein
LSWKIVLHAYPVLKVDVDPVETGFSHDFGIHGGPAVQPASMYRFAIL